jgi:hypothetical protein
MCMCAFTQDKQKLISTIHKSPPEKEILQTEVNVRLATGFLSLFLSSLSLSNAFSFISDEATMKLVDAKM